MGRQTSGSSAPGSMLKNSSVVIVAQLVSSASHPTSNHGGQAGLGNVPAAIFSALSQADLDLLAAV